MNRENQKNTSSENDLSQNEKDNNENMVRVRVRVKGYRKGDGTWVKGHYKSMNVNPWKISKSYKKYFKKLR